MKQQPSLNYRLNEFRQHCVRMNPDLDLQCARVNDSAKKLFLKPVDARARARITRQRVIGLLRQNGVKVVEKTLAYQDFEKADEIFATGNYSKVVSVTRIGDRHLPFGPIYTKARELFWLFAHS